MTLIEDDISVPLEAEEGEIPIIQYIVEGGDDEEKKDPVEGEEKKESDNEEIKEPQPIPIPKTPKFSDDEIEEAPEKKETKKERISSKSLANRDLIQIEKL